MNWWYRLNLMFFAVCETLEFFFSDEFHIKIRNAIIDYGLRGLRFFKMVIEILRDFLFPIRANTIKHEHNRRLIDVEEIETELDRKKVVLTRQIILPPSKNVYRWDYVEGVYEEDDPDDFSSTDEEVDYSKKDEVPKKKSTFLTTNMTSVINKFKGPYNDFYGIPITPYNIDEHLHKLIFYKKDRHTGKILIQKEFTTNQIINLYEFL